ncbi:hypothetical protein [Nocardiopsis sp. B62]|uniref:hypothetical protein n=1 Tax=Nocardiopsis sp. B62 TaxID=2824874 RepID=UPI001B399AC9|nr:hypothetical protein [Nocardiopsis sp. B62]MBQ1080971.1 hypothetical protein [Nocardiopsis sp. B62]
MEPSELVARVDFDEDVTEEEAEQHTRDLVLLLEDLDVDEVGVAEGDSVTGTRSADPALLAGAVVLAGAFLRPVLAALVTLLGQWIEQSGQRSVTVELGDAKVTVKGRVGTGEVEAYVRALNEGRKTQVTAKDGD